VADRVIYSDTRDAPKSNLPDRVGNKKPIEQGLIRRVTQGVKYMISGVTPDTWMGPSQPMQPAAQEVAGRQYDFSVAQNIDYSNRVLAGVSWYELRALANNYDLLRCAIETRKDQVSKLEWIISPKDKKADVENAKIDELTKFFAFPDKLNNWDLWLRMLMEDLLVIDAPTLYPRFTNGNKLYSLEIMDGATIRRLIDDSGRTPLPPSPAYQQILKGIPAVDYSLDELIYAPRNLRPNTVYGYSPVEQIIMTVNIAIRRQLSQLQYYTEGNIPDAFITCPESWNTNQIKDFQIAWDSYMSGNTGERRKAKFIAGGAQIHETRENPLKDEYDEWLARIVCYCFNISPQALIKQMNRATAQTAQETAVEEGLTPLMNWIKNFINGIIVKYFGYTDVEFTWKEEQDQDPLTQSQINDLYIRNGVKSVDEVRAELGLDPIGMSNAVYGSMGVEFVKDLIDPNYQDAKMQQNAQLSLQDNSNVNEKEKEKPKPDEEKNTEEQKLLKRQKKKRVLKRINRERALVNKKTFQLKKYLSKFLKKEGKKITAKIIGKINKADIPSDVQKILDDIDFQGWSVIVGDVEEMLQSMGEDGAKLALLQLGGIADDKTIVSSSDAVTNDYAKRRAAELVGMRYTAEGDLIENPNAKWAITDSTRDMLRSTVTTALEEGWSNDHLADELENNFAFSSSRAETIARTEIKRADMQGSLSAYKESGVVQGKESLLSFDYDDDDECQENADAGVIPLDEDFPSGDDAPPYHPNCRCDLVPSVIEGEDNEEPEQETDEENTEEN